mgnify:CR=1 FL=1
MTTQNPATQLRRAIHARGYQLLATHLGAQQTEVHSWEVFSRAGDSPLLVLQTYKDGGCELFSPLCTDASLEATIAAIP